MILEDIIRLKEEHKFEEAFALAIRTLKDFGVDVRNKNSFSNAVKIDIISMKSRFLKPSLNRKATLDQKEEKILDVVLETLPLATVFDEIVVVNLFIYLINLTIKKGVHSATFLAIIGHAYLKVSVGKSLLEGLKYLQLAEKYATNDDKRVRALGNYYICLYLNHLRDEAKDSRKILLDTKAVCEDIVLKDLIEVQIASNAVFTGAPLQTILDCEVASKEMVNEENRLLLYKTYAKALMSNEEIGETFLLDISNDDERNKFISELLSMMYFTMTNNIKAASKFRVLVARKRERYLHYQLTFLYSVFNGVLQIKKSNYTSSVKTLTVVVNIIKDLEFFLFSKNNIMHGSVRFYVGVKDMLIGNVSIARKRLTGSLLETRRLDNMMLYPVFSEVFSKFCDLNNLKKTSRYYYLESAKSYDRLGALRLKDMVNVKVYDNIYKQLHESEISSKEKETMIMFEDLLKENNNYEEVLIDIIRTKFEREKVLIFYKKDKKIYNDGIYIEARDDVAKKCIKYSFKNKEKVIITEGNIHKTGKVDKYILDNQDKKLLVVPFKTMDKVLYIEDSNPISFETETAIVDLVETVAFILSKNE